MKKVYCKSCYFYKRWDLGEYFCSRLYDKLIMFRTNKFTNEVIRIDRHYILSTSFKPNKFGLCIDFKNLLDKNKLNFWLKKIKVFLTYQH